MQIKKERLFLVEVFELQDYFYYERGYRLSYNYSLGHFTKEEAEHYSVNASCYKRTYKKYVRSVSKLNKELGVKDYTKYFLNNSLNSAIKGANCISRLRNLTTVLVVKEL